MQGCLFSRLPSVMRKQQSEMPRGYPARVVGEDVFDWDNPNYSPKEYNALFLSSDPKPNWADEQDVASAEVGERLIFDKNANTTVAALCDLDITTNRYRNPWGQTGVSGRGDLGRWGPNYAADNIITRQAADKRYEVLLVRKNVGDSSTLAFPAGMVEPGQTVSQTLKAELLQEAVKDDSDSKHSFVNRLFSSECDQGSVYKGQVDDYRNTDHAWIVTTAQWFHATKDVAEGLCIAVADSEEIASAAWYKIDDVTDMYASHMDWLNLVKERLEKDDAEATVNAKAETLRAQFAAKAEAEAQTKDKKAQTQGKAKADAEVGDDRKRPRSEDDEVALPTAKRCTTLAA